MDYKGGQKEQSKMKTKFERIRNPPPIHGNQDTAFYSPQKADGVWQAV